MQSPLQSAQKQLQQVSLYDNLTLLMKLFKNILKYTQSISLQLSKSQQCAQDMQILRRLVRQDHKSIEDYSYELEEDAQHRNINQRFVCRIVQNLQVFKNTSYAACQTSNVFIQFIDRIDFLLNSWKSGKNIGKLFKKICSITERFCKSCEIIMKRGSNQQALQYFLRKSKEEKQEANIIQSVSRKYHFANSESNFQKIMSGLTRRYNTLSCLDLDYSAFKATFFKSKQEKSELQREMLQRNGFIYRQIYFYSKQFENYLKRKEKIQMRRNRFKDNPRKFGNTHSISIKEPSYFKNSVNVTRVIDTQHERSQSNDSRCQIPKFSQGKERNSKKYQISQEKLTQYQKRRSSYQIKNVFLTLNKIQVNDINKNKMKPQKKYDSKDKSKAFSIFKPDRYTLRSSKFINSQLMNGERPLLQIRHIDFKGYQISMQQEQSNLLVKKKQDEVLKAETTYKMQKIERKRVRITQILKKNSLGVKDNTHEYQGEYRKHAEEREGAIAIETEFNTKQN